jgi:hypothetical protein
MILGSGIAWSWRRFNPEYGAPLEVGSECWGEIIFPIGIAFDCVVIDCFDFANLGE